MSIFYVGLNPRYQQFSWLPSGLNVMYSAAGFWGGYDWRRRKRYVKQAGSRWLDFGGFTLLNAYGEYPFSIPEAMNLVAILKPHFYGSLDYPCEPEISRGLSLMNNAERIRATVENAAKMTEWEGHVRSQFVPVIQGYTLDEYLSCIDLHAAQGTIREYMAVGSMCRRIKSAELHRLIPGIYESAVLAGAKRLHFFGLKLSRDLVDLAPMIYSRDSAVALDDYSGELRQSRGGRRWPKGPHEKRESFNTFFQRLEELGLRYS